MPNEMSEELRARRMRENFPFTEEVILARFCEQVPDFSAEDLRRLEREGYAESAVIDGEKRYIHNAVRTALQEDEKLRARAGLPPVGEEEKKALQEEIRRMKKNGGCCRRFRLRSSIRLADECFHPGMTLRAHLPIPAELHQTSDVEILAHTDGKVSIDDPRSLCRTICFEDTPKGNHEFFVEYAYTVTLPYRNPAQGLTSESGRAAAGRQETASGADRQGMANGQATSGSSRLLTPDDCLQEQAPHILFTPFLRDLAEKITAGIDEEPSDSGGTALRKAEAIYRFITTNVRYAYMRDYALFDENIPEYCARTLRGDCGVQTLLFISLCRICGIPAAWQSGLYFAGTEDPGPHDWALFYAEPYGWLYADPSIGGSAYRRGDKELWDFYFGNIDPFRMAANHAFMQPFAVPKQFPANDPCDNQVGEIESDQEGFYGKDVETSRVLLCAERKY